MTSEGLGRAVRSEWTKLMSLRSSRWTLIAFPLTGIALGALIAVITGANWPHASAETRVAWDPTNNILAGLIPGYLVIPVLGVLVMTSEYTHGAIRSTLAAVPRRSVVLAAKAAVVAGVAFVACEVVTFAAFLLGQRLMGSAPRPSLTQAGVWRVLVLSGAYLGAVIRNSGGAIAVYAATALVVPEVCRPSPATFGASDRSSSWPTR